jgi:hypothetical protein
METDASGAVNAPGPNASVSVSSDRQTQAMPVRGRPRAWRLGNRQDWACARIDRSVFAITNELVRSRSTITPAALGPSDPPAVGTRSTNPGVVRPCALGRVRARRAQALAPSQPPRVRVARATPRHGCVAGRSERGAGHPSRRTGPELLSDHGEASAARSAAAAPFYAPKASIWARCRDPTDPDTFAGIGHPSRRSEPTRNSRRSASWPATPGSRFRSSACSCAHAPTYPAHLPGAGAAIADPWYVTFGAVLLVALAWLAGKLAALPNGVHVTAQSAERLPPAHRGHAPLRGGRHRDSEIARTQYSTRS